MTKKTWSLANGLNALNTEGQSILCELGPPDFDVRYEETERAAMMGIKAPYHRDGSYYIFQHKRDWLDAIETLRERGYAVSCVSVGATRRPERKQNEQTNTTN